jgi:hypothetical protein
MCIWGMQHVMHNDPCRRATFSMTVKNATTRVCHSSVIISKAFNFIIVCIFSMDDFRIIWLTGIQLAT